MVSALEALSTANNESGGCFDYWFKSFDIALAGRGKMGSLVGASEEVRKGGGVDSSLNDYAVCATENDLRSLLYCFFIYFSSRIFSW